MIEISVVIPTYNRLTTLLNCLQALEQQTLDRASYEVIVVDDGSTDATGARLRQQSTIRFFQQPRNAGPAAARNVGVRAANGRYVLFLGDDTIARPHLLKQHLQEQAQHRDDRLAVLGYAPWSQDHEITPLMRYLLHGPSIFRQFKYDAITDRDNVPFWFFYTSNVSLSRDFMLRHGLFDENFRVACCEDTELAYRLQGQGLHIIFRPQIIADHVHPTSYRSTCRRARSAGEAMVLMAQKHPELIDLNFLRFSPKTRIANRIKRHLTWRLIDPLLELADRRHWQHPLLAHAYDWALCKHQMWAMLDASVARGRSATVSR